MRWPSIKTLRAKLTVIAMATTGFAIVVMGVGLAGFEVMSHRRHLSRELSTVAEMIGANSTAALSFDDATAAREVLHALSSQPAVHAGCLYVDRGALFATYERPDGQWRCRVQPEPDGLEIRTDSMVLTTAVNLKGKRIGTLTVWASRDELGRRLERFSWVLAAVVLVSLGAAWVLSGRLQRLVSEPIVRLAETARRVSLENDYNLRAPLTTSDETGLAVTAFNQMLDRVEMADRSLREQAHFLSSIVDAMGEGLVVCDPDGHFLLWNSTATRLLGERVDLPFAKWPEHFGLHRADGQTLLQPGELTLVQALSGESVAEQEVFVSPPHRGTSMWLSVSARPLKTEAGVIRGAIAVMRDVTQRKRAEDELRASEAQLRQAQKMEAIGRLAGGIAHDFNNLLTIIFGNSRIVLDELKPDDPLRADIEDVHSAAERAAALTRQLLAFSRKQVLDAQPLDLNVVVASLEKMLTRLIGETVELKCVYEPMLGVVKADVGQLEQVIMNLVVNARDAMPKGGLLTITTSNVELDERQAALYPGAKPGPKVLLTVSDTGLGMDSQTLSRVFEPFFTTKEMGRGTGLGLSTVLGIVEQSGGHVAVSSELGHGSTFRIYLPQVSEAASAQVPSRPMSAVPRGTETILLVEDEVAVLKFVESILVSLGYRVVTASNGVEALSRFDEHSSIDLLLSDVVMPRMGGPDLARALLERTPRLPILFVSGYTADALANHGLVGVTPGFLQKPFSPDALARKVRETLDAVRRRSS